MESANGRGAPPPELTMAWLCDRWGALPEDGGAFEQDYELMTRMQKLSNIYSVVSKLRSLSGDAINTQLSTEERLMLGELRDMGLLRGLRS